jgi:hypothetical protein
VKAANTGLDPLGSLWEFVKKDVTKNIDVHRDTTHRVDDLAARKDFPAIGTTKKMRGDKVPAVTCTSLEGSGEDRVVRLKTDHISFNPPANEQKFQATLDKVVTAAPYSGNFETAQGWKEKSGYKTVNNRGSVPYNIITNDTNPYSGAQILKTLDKKVTNRKKGLAEFYDLTRVAAIKANEGHQHAFAQNPQVFYRKLGIFTNTYDAAVRNGTPAGPFKQKK